jgi:HEAT repeat protein
VVYALARMETSEAEQALRGLLSDPHHAVRVTVLRVYMRPWLRPRVEAEDALAAAVGDLLRTDASEVVRGAAAGLLGLVGRPDVPGILAATLAGPAKDAHPYPRSEAAAALARRDGDVARSALVAALDDPDAGVRRAAIEALFRLAFTWNGYDPDAAPEQRAEATGRWRRWLDEGRK